MDQNGSRQRRAQRQPVTMSATCRTGTGRSGDVVITDLTADGCCIFTKAVALSAGLKVRIHPANFQVLPGVVRWSNRGYAGIEFDAPLYGPVAVHLQQAFASLQH
jgi:hypothetical protein